jgi:hypothetical protein
MLLWKQAGVLQIERRTVVDQPQPVMPDKQARVPWRPVDVRQEGIEPHDLGGQRRVGDPVGPGSVCGGPGEEVDAEVAARARVQALRR